MRRGFLVAVCDKSDERASIFFVTICNILYFYILDYVGKIPPIVCTILWLGINESEALLRLMIARREFTLVL